MAGGRLLLPNLEIRVSDAFQYQLWFGVCPSGMDGEGVALGFKMAPPSEVEIRAGITVHVVAEFSTPTVVLVVRTSLSVSHGMAWRLKSPLISRQTQHLANNVLTIKGRRTA
jgi:hypothetical protein